MQQEKLFYLLGIDLVKTAWGNLAPWDQGQDSSRIRY